MQCLLLISFDNNPISLIFIKLQFLIVEDRVDRLLQQRHIVTGLPAAAPPPAGGVPGGVEAEDVEDQEDGGEGDHCSEVSELHHSRGGWYVWSLSTRCS